MNAKLVMPLLAAMVAGCACDKACKYDAADPVVGNWGVKLEQYSAFDACHLIISRKADGSASASVLMRFSSPVEQPCEITGNRFVIRHVNGYDLEGEVVGDVMKGTMTVRRPNEWYTAKRDNGTFTGWRNPPICGKASTKDAKFGAPIDLLKDGLDGWQAMGKNGRFCWSFKDGVLSNRVGKKPDGSWLGGGINLMSKRSDFYDFKLDYDVRVPANSNSGVYLRGRYEIQVLDSFGKPVDRHNMAALYGRITPALAAEKPAGEWQHVTVVLYKRHLTVVLNGKTVIDDQPVEGVTGGAIDAREFVAGPIYIQGDHSDADYKNIILCPAK